MGKLVIDGNSVYEIDEECLRKRENNEKHQEETSREYRTAEKTMYRRNNNNQ